MTKESINLNEQVIDKSLDRTKDYLSNIEKIFGKHLKEEDKGNYDGELKTSTDKGEQTEIERYYAEDFGSLKNKLENQKTNLTKQKLVSTLLHDMLKEKGVTYNNIAREIEPGNRSELFKELNKEQADFTKDIASIGEGLDSAYEGAVEISYTKKQVETANYNYELACELDSNLDKNKIGKSDTSMSILDEYNSESKKVELQNDLLDRNEKENKEAYTVYASLINKNEKEKGSISSEVLIKARKEYESVIIKNSDLAYSYNIGEANLERYSKILDYGMTSGLAPIAMMVTPIIKKGLPILPAVIGAGMYTRFMHIIQSDKVDVWEKTGEIGKIISYTITSIAPISGTAIAGYETKEAYNRYLEGKGSFEDVIANGAGTLVSAVFDGVTVFLIATGVGAAPAVGVQASKVAAKEATKAGFKKMLSFLMTSKGQKFFINKSIEKSKNIIPSIINKTKQITKNTNNASKALLGGKTTINESTKYSTEYSLKTAGKVWNEIGKDTLQSFKQIFTFKQSRDLLNQGIFMIPKLGEKYAQLRPEKFIKLGNKAQKANYLEGGIIAKSSIERNNETGEYLDPMIAKELEYIDSLKNDLSINASDKLIEEMVNLKDVFKKGEIRKLKTMKSRLKKDIKDGRNKEHYERLEKNIKELENKNDLIIIKLNKILDIINFRNKQIELNGTQKEKQNNIILVKKSHDTTKKIFGEKNIPEDIKLNILKDIWKDSTIKFEYHKDHDVQNYVKDILKGEDLDFQTKLIIQLQKKFSKKQLQTLLPEGKKIEEIGAEIISKNINNKIQDIYNINILYRNLNGLKYNEELLVKVIENIKNGFNNSESGHKMLGLSFIKNYGNIVKEINKNEIFRAQVVELIEKHNKDGDYFFRGLYNIHKYIKGSSIDNKTESIITKRFFGGDNAKFENFNKKTNKSEIEKDLNSLNINKTSDGITDFLKHTLNSLINNNKSKNSDKELLYHSEDLIDLIRLNQDILKPEDIKELNRFLTNKVKELEISDKSQELILLTKILGETGYKINYNQSDNLSDFTKTLYIKNGIIKITKNDKSANDYLIKKLEFFGKNGIESKDEKYIYDMLFTFDMLGSKFKDSSSDRSYKDKFKNLQTKQGNNIEENIRKILNGKEGFISKYRSLTNKLGFDIEVKLGEGILLKDKSGTGDKINLKISDSINLKGDLRNKALSNSNFIKGKYNENIGYINRVSFNTGYHKTTKSSENEIYNNILDVSREFEVIKDFDSNNIRKLMEEYSIERLGDRFRNKVFLSNNFIKEGIKVDTIKEILIKDITDTHDKENKLIPAVNKMSLIHNIQDEKIQTELFKELINSKTLTKENLQHELFKKLSSKIDNIDTNRKVIGDILGLEKSLKRGEGLDELSSLIGIIQQNKNIDQGPVNQLIDLFKNINNRYKSTTDETLLRKYDDILLEFTRINLLQTNNGITKYITQSIQKETDLTSDFLRKKLMAGFDMIKNYQNIEKNINIGIDGVKSLEKLTAVIKDKLISVGIRGNDLIEGSDIGKILGPEIMGGMSKLNLEIIKIEGIEVYYKVKNIDNIMTSKEIIQYQKSIAELSSIIINSKGTIRASDLTEYISEESLKILEKNGFKVEEFIKYKNGESKEYKSNNKTIDDIVNYNPENNKALGDAILTIRGDADFSKEEMKNLEQEYILLINKIDSLDASIKSDKLKLEGEIKKLVNSSDELRKFFDKNPDEYDKFIKNSINQFILDINPKLGDNNKDYIKNFVQKAAGVAIVFRLLTPDELMAMTDDVLYDVEDAWEVSPEKKEFEKLIALNKLEEAHKLKRDTIIELTKVTTKDYMSKYEQTLNNHIMASIDKSIEEATTWNIPKEQKQEFAKQYKHEFYQYIIDNDTNSQLSKIFYVSDASSIDNKTHLIENVQKYVGQHPIIKRELENIANNALEKTFKGEDIEKNKGEAYNFTRLLIGKMQ